MSINSVVLVGRAGQEPAFKELRDGAKVANVSMAVQRPTKEDQTDWIDIQLWGKAAEIAAKYVKKGAMFGVQGVLRKETWDDKNSGEKRSRMLVVANQLRLLESKKGGGDNADSGDSADFFGEE